NGHNNLRVVLVAFHEERADRAVDQAGNERLVFARTAFTLEVAAGDLARSERLFLVVDGEREEILARLRLLRRNDGGENDGLTVGGQNGAVCLAGDLARFEDERTPSPFDLDFMFLEHVLSLRVGPASVQSPFHSWDQPRARQRDACNQASCNPAP